MTHFDALFFDVDDTLLDFQEAEDGALHLLFDEQGLPLTAAVRDHYQTYNRSIWKRIETGLEDRKELLRQRFANFFAAYGLDVDGARLERRYQELLSGSHRLIDGAWHVLTELKKNYALYIVTNGVSATQRRRLRDSHLDTLFDAVFISEDVGTQKPDPDFFRYAFNRLQGFSPEKGMIIGDSLTSDIQGGHNAGMATCWFNPNHTPNQSTAAPSMEIHRLDELLHSLNAGKTIPSTR